MLVVYYQASAAEVNVAIEKCLLERFPAAQLDTIQVCSEFYSKVFAGHEDVDWAAGKAVLSISIVLGDLSKVSEAEALQILNESFLKHLKDVISNYPGDQKAAAIEGEIVEGINVFEDTLSKAILDTRFISIKKHESLRYVKALNERLAEMPSFDSTPYVGGMDKLYEHIIHMDLSNSLLQHLKFVTERKKKLAYMMTHDVFSYSNEPRGSFANKDFFIRIAADMIQAHGESFSIISMTRWQFHLDAYLQLYDTERLATVRQHVLETYSSLPDQVKESPDKFLVISSPASKANY